MNHNETDLIRFLRYGIESIAILTQPQAPEASPVINTLAVTMLTRLKEEEFKRQTMDFKDMRVIPG